MLRAILSSVPAFVFAAGALLNADNVPRPAPELVIKQVGAPDLLLSSLRGKIVALEFVLTTCQHCQRASQVLNKMHQEFGARGFQPVAAAINEMGNLYVADYKRQFGLNYPVGYVHRDTAVQFLMHSVMKSMQMPQLVLIDRKGIIREQRAGDDPFFTDDEKSMRAAIQNLLKEPAPGAKKSAPPATKKKSS